jgi:nicotinamidase-related amidase
VFGFLTGVQTPNCIRATAFDAIAHDYPSVVVLSDATAAASDEVHAGTFCYYLEHSHLESDHHVLFLPSIGEHEMPCIWI